MDSSFLVLGGIGVLAIVGAILYFSRSNASGAAAKPTAGTALKMEYQPFVLAEKTNVSHNTIMFRFKLPSAKQRLGLPVGKHVLLKFQEEKEAVSRPYTPVSSDDNIGYFDLVIKVYPSGKMSQHLAKLEVGGTIDVRGPLGEIEYVGHGEFKIRRKDASGKNAWVSKKVSRVNLLAGGTGITPMLQIIREVLKHSDDTTELRLIFANVTEDDILLRNELESYRKTHPGQFSLFYTLDKPNTGWTGGVGFISTDMMQKHLAEPAADVITLVCGPPPMVKAMQKNLEGLDCTPEQYFCY